jgi:hypothetical protein
LAATAMQSDLHGPSRDPPRSAARAR